jgi:hypothetical protein
MSSRRERLGAWMIAVRVVIFMIGVVVVAGTLGSAVRTVILPRGIPARLARIVFLAMRFVFRLRTGRSATYEKQDRIMALYAPLSLLVLLVVWLTSVLIGYAGMLWGLGGRSVQDAFVLSGSSLLTLGFARAEELAPTLLAFTEAAIGLILLALLITYLPSLYGAFSRREAAVTALEVRAGAPPSGVEMIERFWVLERIDKLGEVWTQWEGWFVDIEETHTSFPALVFFRSPQPDHSWITAAGAVLDAASLTASTVVTPRDVQAEICIRAGYLALRRIAHFFSIPYDPDPAPNDPITVTRGEFDSAYDRLAGAGVPLRPDRDEAWRNYAGWRVNYDTVLVALAELTMAPMAPWSSDRALRSWRPPIFVRRARPRI